MCPALTVRKNDGQDDSGGSGQRWLRGGGVGGGWSALHSCWPVAPSGRHGKTRKRKRTKCATLGTPVNCRGGGSGGGGGGFHSRHGHAAKLWPQLGLWMGDEDQESLGDEE